MGKNPDAGLSLQDAGISAEHARIEAEGEALFISDLESEFGTYLNGRRLTTRERLNPGDHLRFHTVLVDVSAEPAAARQNSPAARPPKADAPPAGRPRSLPKLATPTKPRTLRSARPNTAQLPVSKPPVPSRGPMTLRAPKSQGPATKGRRPRRAMEGEQLKPVRPRSMTIRSTPTGRPPQALSGRRAPRPPEVGGPPSDFGPRSPTQRILPALSRPNADGVRRAVPALPRPRPEKPPAPAYPDRPAPLEKLAQREMEPPASDFNQPQEPLAPPYRPGKKTRRLVEYSSQILGAVLRDLEGAAACAAIDLRSGMCLNVQHIFPNLPRETEHFIAQAALDTFSGSSLQRLEKYWGAGEWKTPEELFLKSANVLYFMKAVPAKSLLLVVITAKTANLALGWLKLRDAAQQIGRHSGSMDKGPRPKLVENGRMLALLEHENEKTHNETSAAPSRRSDDSDGFFAVQTALRSEFNDSQAKSFSGDLGNFGLTSVLQLISRECKTGLFQVEAANRNLSIVFEKGRIATGWWGEESPNHGLLDLLGRRGFAPKATLTKVGRRSSFRNIPLIDALLESGCVSPDELADCTGQLLTDRILETMLWKDGKYTFHPGRHPHNSYGEPIDVERLLFRGALIADELPRIRRVLPHNQVEISPLAGPVESLPDDLQAFYQRLPSRAMPVSAIQSRVPEGWFDCLKKLYDLQKHGCLRVYTADSDTYDDIVQAVEQEPDLALPPVRSTVVELTGQARLRMLRKAAGLGIRDAARRVGVQPEEWKRWERNLRPIPIPYRSRILAFLPDASEIFE